MLSTLVFSGVNPMISIESEEFGSNMTAGVLIGIKQLEIHGKWWYIFYKGIWVYIGVRTCDVFFHFVTSSGVLLLFDVLLAPCFL